MGLMKDAQIGAVILARLDSSRLPGKQLKMVKGKLLLDYVLERARRIEGVDKVVLATTARSLDDPLEEFAGERGIAVFRGSAEDVAGRVLACARHFGFDAWVRVNADSPLLDFKLFSKALEIFRSGGFDIVTNVLRRTFPVGNSVEVFSTNVFAKGYAKMTSPEHFEHVTKYFYDNPSGLSIHNIESENGSWGSAHLAVDTPDDLKRFEWIVDAFERDHLEYAGKDVINLYYEYEKH